MARIAIYRAPPASAAVSLPASDGGSLSESATVLAGVTQMVWVTQPAGAVDNAVFTTQPVLQARNAANGNVAQAGISVTLTIQSGAGTGTLSGTVTRVTDANGTITHTDLKLDANTPPAVYTLRATPVGLPVVDSAAFTVAAGASQLTITSQPTTGVDNAAFPTAFVVQLRTSGGVAVAQSGVVITANMLTGVGTLIGSVTAVTDASGAATFSTLGINDTADDYLPTLALDWDMAALPGLLPAVVGGWQASENVAQSTLYSNLSLVSNSALTITGSHNVMRTTFQTTTQGGFAPVNVYPSGFTWPSNNGSFDYEFSLYIDPLFDNNAAGGNIGTKLWFFGSTSNNHFIGINANRYDGAALGGTLGNCTLVVGLQSPTAGTWYTDAHLDRGTAYVIRVQGLANTPGVANGQLRVWVRGGTYGSTPTLVMLNTGANNAPSATVQNNLQYYSAAQTPVQNRIVWSPTYGGGVQSPPVQAYIDCGHIRVFTSP